MLTITNTSFVRRSGDTMTGTLAIVGTSTQTLLRLVSTNTFRIYDLASSGCVQFASQFGDIVSMNLTGSPAVNFGIGALSSFCWNSANAANAQGADLFLARDAANTLAQRNSTNAQAFNIYNTYTDASNYEKGQLAWSSNAFYVGTVKAGTGSARQMNFMINGNPVWIMNTSGHFLAQTDNSFDIGASGASRPRNGYFGTSIQSGNEVVVENVYKWRLLGAIYGISDGVFRLQDFAGTSFGRLQFGGSTNAFPSVKRFNTDLQLRLADDSDYTNLFLGNLRVNVKKVSANYTGLYNDSIIYCTTGLTITLPPANIATGMLLTIKDASGAAPVSNITITGSGSQLIDGNLGLTISAPYASYSLCSEGNNCWFVV